MSDQIPREAVERLREFVREQGIRAAEDAEVAKAASDARAWARHHREEIGLKTTAFYLGVLLGEESEDRPEHLVEALVEAGQATAG